jgi:hypothetical protein
MNRKPILVEWDSVSPDNSSTITTKGKHSVCQGLEIGMGDFTALLNGQKIFLQFTHDCVAAIGGRVEMSVGIHQSPENRNSTLVQKKTSLCGQIKKWTLTELVDVVRISSKFEDQIGYTTRTTRRKIKPFKMIAHISIHCHMKNIKCSTWIDVSDEIRITFLQLVLFLVGHLWGYLIQDNQEKIKNFRKVIILYIITIPKFNKRDNCWIRETL